MILVWSVVNVGASYSTCWSPREGGGIIEISLLSLFVDGGISFYRGSFSSG